LGPFRTFKIQRTFPGRHFCLPASSLLAGISTLPKLSNGSSSLGRSPKFYISQKFSRAYSRHLLGRFFFSANLERSFGYIPSVYTQDFPDDSFPKPKGRLGGMANPFRLQYPITFKPSGPYFLLEGFQWGPTSSVSLRPESALGG